MVGALGRAVVRRTWWPPTTARARRSRRTSGSTTPTSATRCSARSRRGCSAAPGGRPCSTRILAPLGMSRTSYLPEGAAAQGRRCTRTTAPWSTSPRPTPARWRRPGQVWATITDLATYAAFLRQGSPGRAVGRGAGPGVRAAVRHARGRHQVPARTGLPDLRGRIGHARRPHRLDARASSRPAGRPQAPDRRRGARQRDDGLLAGRDRDGAARRARALRADHRPSRGGRQRACPPELAGVPGVWHWGNTPFVFAMEGKRLVGAAQRRRGVLASRSATAGWSA